MVTPASRSFFGGLIALPLLAALVGASGCGDSSASAPDAGAGTGPFLAYAANFDGFHNWNSANAASVDDAGDGLHGVGPLRVYWSQSPPHGSKTFPVGTIIVKETEGADVTQRATFAMVKRGDGYNASGAEGWEWFSLKDAPDGSVTVLWRGTIPLAGETYSNQPIGDCNGCHSLANRNDSVWDTALELSSF
jgi:hypothetical protein